MAPSPQIPSNNPLTATLFEAPLNPGETEGEEFPVGAVPLPPAPPDPEPDPEPEPVPEPVPLPLPVPVDFATPEAPATPGMLVVIAGTETPTEVPFAGGTIVVKPVEAALGAVA